MPDIKPKALPLQPLIRDGHQTIRFRDNSIVRWLLDTHPNEHILNDIALMPFLVEDREQFYQLIGYSLSGFEGLDFVRDETKERTANAHAALLNKETR